MRIVTGLIALALGCAAAPCWAQSNGATVSKIPFEFTINNLTLPAGEYTTQEVGQHLYSLYSIGNKTEALRALSLVHPIAPNEARLAQLVFRKYGDKYFLAEAWNPFRAEVMAFIKCRKEKELVTSRLVSGIRVERVVVLARIR